MADTNGTTRVVAPSKLAHVVLRTNQLEKMTDFYVSFLGGRIAAASPMLAFITYDDEHHRIALAQIPECQDKVRNSCGLEHIAFTFESLTNLLTAYR